jgi:hypothetical protein
MERTGASELPLSICYRSPRLHVQIAQKLVPHIQARADAPEGIVEQRPERELAQYVQPGDLVICRLKAPLVTWCIRLVQAHVAAHIRGLDIAEELVHMVQYLSETDGFDYRLFIQHLDEYETEQESRLSGFQHSAGSLQMLKDKCEALRVCYRSLAAASAGDLCRAIKSLFCDGGTSVWLSTVHRAKGLEADTVFILSPHRLPLEWPGQQAWEWAQELNLRYVAVTRATRRLVILQPDDLSVDYTDDYINERMIEKDAEYAIQADAGDEP